MRRQRFPAFDPSGEDVQHARREDVAQDLGQTQTGEGSLVGRLDDDGIASGQKRGHLRTRKHGRVVEGDDTGDHARRLSQRIVEGVVRLGIVSPRTMGVRPAK